MIFAKVLASVSNTTTNPLSEGKYLINKSVDKWLPPILGKVKWNVDASVVLNCDKSAFAVVCRNHCGDLIFAAVMFNTNSSVIVNETLAINLAMDRSRELLLSLMPKMSLIFVMGN
ncbi:hypothetical protein Cni_G19367 [Canna indica]|uniref:RNase H type-1 domain-containing protein n=1 Tax=Canna indica TaxID=4628 RepID=A0AAQ3KKF5_9LILI|nr:hypothetical protein Cni_G19367 [Canna indica]